MRSLLSSWNKLVVAICFAVCVPYGLAQSSSSASAQKPADFDGNDPDRQQAMQLFDQHKMPEAVPLLEKVVAKYPKDVVTHERLGVALVSRADTQSDPEKAKEDRIHARSELLRARELGDNSDLCKTLLAMIREDGSGSSFSAKAEADAAMKRGEAAYAKGAWEEAIKEYSRALELDPKLYLAAVNIGDTYFAQKQMDKAGEWFAAAVRIDPDRETAYRYWGDALLGQGKMKEARSKFIEGVVANPYRPPSWNGLNNWLSRNHLKMKDIPIELPAGPTTNDKGETVIALDASILGNKNDSSGAAWLVYSGERSLWRTDKFTKEFPQETTYRHSLKEEVSALSLTVSVFHELQQKKKDKNPNPSLTLLSQFKAEGLLEPYVLLIKPDKGIAQDYEAYRTAHREKLVEFLDKYVVPSPQ
ncbi:MAG TPA: tetratricopeptide repeat protein [Candidatus Angelobacter sp.]|jgi:tetratricopeptide (TPR) repeat protein|nr:tetratricopeptide repeat protein [Candidatus Angelobacter sp.]